VLSIEAKQTADRKWECYIDNGREKTGIDVIDWVKKIQELGAGEILLTSIDNEGTKKGFDIPLISEVMKIAKIPVIASGGMGTLTHVIELIQETDIDAIAVASVLHYHLFSLSDIHRTVSTLGFEVRT
jgi:cyclase